MTDIITRLHLRKSFSVTFCPGQICSKIFLKIKSILKIKILVLVLANCRGQNIRNKTSEKRMIYLQYWKKKLCFSSRDNINMRRKTMPVSN